MSVATLHELAIVLERNLGLDRAAAHTAEIAAREVELGDTPFWAPLNQLLERRAAAVAGPSPMVGTRV